jgi:predicted RNase H-like nuclease (RuvC/YqgF family)
MQISFCASYGTRLPIIPRNIAAKARSSGLLAGSRPAIMKMTKASESMSPKSSPNRSGSLIRSRSLKEILPRKKKQSSCHSKKEGGEHVASLQTLEQRIDRLEKLNEELIKKVARANVENFYLSQRVTALEQGYDYPKAVLQTTS